MALSHRVAAERNPARRDEVERLAEPATAWAPRPDAVSPALARMHERLRATRCVGRGAVPDVRDLGARNLAARELARRELATRDLPTRAGMEADAARAGALSAMDGGVAIERSPVPDRAHLAETVERFVRLRGRSGRAYVFSRIEPRHVSLYRNGVFASASRGGERANVVADATPILSNALADDHLYVHLAAGDERDRAAVIEDLS